MEELEKLYLGLISSNTLLLKQHGSSVECQFVVAGMVKYAIRLKCPVLIQALRLHSVGGVLEGGQLMAFKNNFAGFSLHVKANKLYRELAAQPAPYPMRKQHLAMA